MGCIWNSKKHGKSILTGEDQKKKKKLDKSFWKQEEFGCDTVEYKFGAGCGSNGGLLLSARLRRMSFILGRNAHVVTSLITTEMWLKAKVNGWF